MPESWRIFVDLGVAASSSYLFSKGKDQCRNISFIMQSQPSQSGIDSNATDEQQQQQQKQPQPKQQQHQAPLPGMIPPPGMPPPPVEFMMPHTQLELGHSMGGDVLWQARAAYPYPDPYFGSIVAAYGAQAMIHPHMLGVQQAGLPLPSDTVEEPVYVNAKQYHGILRRRQSRAKAESENKLIKCRKPYLHESRHLHALKRARGCGGRFLNAKTDESHEDKVSGERNSHDDTVQHPDGDEPHSVKEGASQKAES